MFRTLLLATGVIALSLIGPAMIVNPSVITAQEVGEKIRIVTHDQDGLEGTVRSVGQDSIHIAHRNWLLLPRLSGFASEEIDYWQPRVGSYWWQGMAGGALGLPALFLILDAAISDSDSSIEIFSTTEVVALLGALGAASGLSVGLMTPRFGERTQFAPTVGLRAVSNQPSRLTIGGRLQF
jgi:hypothetical protein